MSLASLLTIGCDRPANDARGASRPERSQHAPSADAKTAPDSGALTVSALPAAAAAALLKRDATFVPFDVSKYPPQILSAAHRSAGDGIVVVRGDFQGAGRADFAVVGMTTDSLLVLALFAEPDGSYQTINVYSESKRFLPFANTTPPGSPAMYLERAPCEFRCAKKSTFAIVLKFVGDHGPSRTNLAWVPKFHRFLSDEPVD